MGELVAGRAADGVVAITVMGEKPPEQAKYYEKRKEWAWTEQDRGSDGSYLRSVTEYFWPQPYTTNIAAAWEVVEKLWDENFHVQFLIRHQITAGRWLAQFPTRGGSENYVEAVAETAPLAICRAAVKAVGQDGLTTIHNKRL